VGPLEVEVGLQEDWMVLQEEEVGLLEGEVVLLEVWKAPQEGWGKLGE